MRIWILWRGHAEDDNDLVGAYSNPQLAKEAMERIYKERYQEEYDAMLEHPKEDQVMVHPDSMEADLIDEYFEKFDSEMWIDTIELEGTDAAV